ncbi:hypothetical protein N7526_010999 [Penicillium atrosanguineum]|nr:hypothetical protein N7526_010999 [Penicillium atrosanguineum]
MIDHSKVADYSHNVMEKGDLSAEPYRGPKLPNVPDDLVVAGVLNLDCDERLWVPQSKDVWFRPLCFNVSQGYFVNILRADGIISSMTGGPRKAVMLLSPPGDIHTLEVPDGVPEMVTLFHVTGAYIYVDVDGNSLGIEDVFSKLQAARNHYEAIGMGASFADQFVR